MMDNLIGHLSRSIWGLGKDQHVFTRVSIVQNSCIIIWLVWRYTKQKRRKQLV